MEHRSGLCSTLTSPENKEDHGSSGWIVLFSPLFLFLSDFLFFPLFSKTPICFLQRERIGRAFRFTDEGVLVGGVLSNWRVLSSLLSKTPFLSFLQREVGGFLFIEAKNWEGVLTFRAGV